MHSWCLHVVSHVFPCSKDLEPLRRNAQLVSTTGTPGRGRFFGERGSCAMADKSLDAWLEWLCGSNQNAEISPKKWGNSTLKWICHCNSSIQVDIFWYVTLNNYLIFGCWHGQYHTKKLLRRAQNPCSYVVFWTFSIQECRPHWGKQHEKIVNGHMTWKACWRGCWLRMPAWMIEWLTVTECMNEQMTEWLISEGPSSSLSELFFELPFL